MYKRQRLLNSHSSDTIVDAWPTYSPINVTCCVILSIKIGLRLDVRIACELSLNISKQNPCGTLRHYAENTDKSHSCYIGVKYVCARQCKKYVCTDCAENTLYKNLKSHVIILLGIGYQLTYFVLYF